MSPTMTLTLAIAIVIACWMGLIWAIPRYVFADPS